MQDTGTTTFRPPYTPVAFAALAGRDRGRLFDPERVTALHEWHVAAGAVFEDVGQWKRPRYYPQPGEDMEAAVLRECAAARTGVGILDGSTLGKIDVQGPDAAVLLDRLYTNLMSSLKVGSVRYGVMCGVDGMVIDDGTVLRLAEDRFLVLTTTGGAAKVLDWMEEWVQTEWPDLRVHCTSVTEQWVTFPVVGPRSRDVIGAVFPEVDVSNEAFPFMTWRDTTLDGVPVRLARISFSGELAFEVYVNPWYAVAVWQRLLEAGRPYGITPYGTETMHVLRAEKGYPIIGQDTDGTVTPQDLGMGWAVSKKKPDFVGKRSFARQANQDPLRKQLVGLLPVDRRTVLPEGSQIVELHADGQLPPPPVPDARPRHLQLPQRRAGTSLRPRPGQGRSVAHRRHRARPRQRHPRPGRGHRVGAGRPRRSPSRWLSCCAPTRSRRGPSPSSDCPTPSASPPSRSSRWSTSGSAPSARRRRRRLGVDLPTIANTWIPADGRAGRLARPRRVAADAAPRRPRRSSRPGSAPPSSRWAGPRRTSRPSGSVCG